MTDNEKAWRLMDEARGIPAEQYFRRIWDDAAAKLEEQLPPPYHAKTDGAPLDVTKHAAYLPVSSDVLMDYGVIPDTRPRVPTPWHRRLRWRTQERIDRARLKVGSWIAGVDLEDRDW